MRTAKYPSLVVTPECFHHHNISFNPTQGGKKFIYPDMGWQLCWYFDWCRVGWDNSNGIMFDSPHVTTVLSTSSRSVSVSSSVTSILSPCQLSGLLNKLMILYQSCNIIKLRPPSRVCQSKTFVKTYTIVQHGNVESNTNIGKLK